MAKAGRARAGGQAGVGDPPGEIRQVIPAFRWLLAPFVVLAFGAVGSLYLNPRRTDDFFSWTIQPPVTAALLGAAYGGTLVFFGLALRERVWADNRIVVTAPFVLSTLTLVATLIHLDKFHLHSDPLPATVAWIWLVVYILVPPALVLLIVLQLRAPGSDPPRVAPSPHGCGSSWWPTAWRPSLEAQSCS